MSNATILVIVRLMVGEQERCFICPRLMAVRAPPLHLLVHGVGGWALTTDVRRAMSKLKAAMTIGSNGQSVAPSFLLRPHHPKRHGDKGDESDGHRR